MAARTEELLIDKVAVRRMKACPELEEKAWQWVVKEGWGARNEQHKILKEAHVYKELIEMVRPKVPQRLLWLEGQPMVVDIAALPLRPDSKVVALGSG